MSSTNKTTNYELSQFIETDRPAWLTDYNGDMRTIDSTMKAISDVASGASGSISELADRMSTAEGNITTNTNNIAALDARADALEAGAQSQAGTIANIQTEQTAQNLGIEAATELGYNLARPYDSASTYAVGDYVLFQNTLYKCTTAIATGEAFDPSKWLAIKATDEISANNIIDLDGNNTTFTFGDAFCRTETGYYSGTYSSTNNAITNPSVQFVSAADNFYMEIGNIAILTLCLKFSFDGVQIAAKDRARFIIETTINNANIKAPMHTCRSNNNDTEPNINNYSMFAANKKISSTFFFYNANSVSTITDRSVYLTFMYKTS